MELKQLLLDALSMDGADIFIVSGSPAMVKCEGKLRGLTQEKLLPRDTEELVRQAYAMSSGRDFDILQVDGDDDFSFSLRARRAFGAMHIGSAAAVQPPSAWWPLVCQTPASCTFRKW